MTGSQKNEQRLRTVDVAKPVGGSRQGSVVQCGECGIYHTGGCAPFDVAVWKKYLGIVKLLKRKWCMDIMQMSLNQAKRFYRRRQAGKQGRQAKQDNMTRAVRQALGGAENAGL
jgi:hypothetical protein